MFRRVFFVPAVAALFALFALFAAQVLAQDAGLGRTDAAISGRGDAGALAEAGIPDGGAIPSAERLPAASLPVLSDRPGGVSLQPRGAATLVGAVAFDGDRLMIELVGAAPGYYRVRVVDEDKCPATPTPSEMVTGEIDETTRSRPMTRFSERGVVVGEVRIGDDGRGRFELPAVRTNTRTPKVGRSASATSTATATATTIWRSAPPAKRRAVGRTARGSFTPGAAAQR